RARLAALRDATASAQHPLAMWVDYWDANLRLSTLQQSDLDAFYSRWSGTYVEDRLRNDWLLELGRRRDWANFSVDFPRFRMNDDREVTCYALLTEHLAGQDVRDAARSAWFAQRDADDGCALLATTLLAAKVFKPADAWRKARLAMELNRPRAVAQAVTLVQPQADSAVQALIDAPTRYLSHKAQATGRGNAELATLALIKLAATDPDAAATALRERWERALPDDLAAWAWAATAKQSAMRLSNDAPEQFQRAERMAGGSAKGAEPAEGAWPDDTLAWKVRAALRANQGAGRWQQVVQGINAMSPAEQSEPVWVYWKARGLQSLATDSQDGEGLRSQAREMLGGIAGQLHFYGKLASEQLGLAVLLPARPPALSPAEREAANTHPGLNRSLLLISIGLRSEGVREWNYSLRGMNDRELLAAAQRACDQELWDRCINTSDRTRTEIDMQQRFPTPFRQQVLARTKEIGLDAAYVYGLIRQESRFVMDAQSAVGASGLMQVMPATAKWTAKRIGLDYRRDQIADRDMNLKLGTGYLKLVLDDFAGSQPLAAAAYNAGPSRSRRWREGPSLEPAVWAENIPFSETRDYVKKVLSNAAYYAAMLGGEAVSLSTRLGKSIGPRESSGPGVDKDLP
ncbi:MAG: lytic transglycosylase domain-containing protein, partial [Burkholderiaceae bacterium]|nr:lytic transglycosylase domain-containing protein [Burkholderiaceae bacterium]